MPKYLKYLVNMNWYFRLRCTPVARCKRSAPAKHRASGADGGTGECSGALTYGGVTGAAGAAFAGASFARASRDSLRRATGVLLTIHYTHMFAFAGIHGFKPTVERTAGGLFPMY